MARRLAFAFAIVAATCTQVRAGDQKLDAALLARVHAPSGDSRVIIRTTDGQPADALIRAFNGTPGRYLTALHSQVARLPDTAIEPLAAHPRVRAISLDRPVRGTMEPTRATIGAVWAREQLGVDGSGVGVAIIDSGVTSWHDDLGSERVVHFEDFVGHQRSAYDDYGHGTHVAGIIAGNGYDSDGSRAGIAPGASLIVLKVLDGAGDGYISDVIAALDYAVAHRAQFNIRIINLSVAAGVHESVHHGSADARGAPCRRVGHRRRHLRGELRTLSQGAGAYGGITAPGNAPWVLTVGASSHNGTATRGDDIVAPFSSRGPTHIDHAAKPDIVAPGVGIESLADSSSSLFAGHPAARLWGTIDTVTPPYLSLTGTSMAAPVVTGTIALMLEAYPSMTPNLVKAVLQYTSEFRSRYDHLTEGAGFLNARGAVLLSQSFASGTAVPAGDPTPWSRHIIWGNRRVRGVIDPSAGVWRARVVWGSAGAREGGNIVWMAPGRDEDDLISGAVCGALCGSAVWGADAPDPGAAWGSMLTLSPDVVVWRRGVKDR